MQDFTGVPAVVDLAAMRDAMVSLGGDPQKINPLVPVDLVIDHSVIVDEFGTPHGLRAQCRARIRAQRRALPLPEMGPAGVRNFRVVPPGTGICHQVNLEYLGQTVWTKDEGDEVVAYPDTCVGTDSHTTMINGLGVLGWGVGGIEAEAAMLGQPISMLLPEVIGFRLTGALKEGVTATDLVLTVVQMLRQKGVVGKFVEFYGPGLDNLTLADRATIGNMGPEYGATCGFFPIDGETSTISPCPAARTASSAGRSLCQGAGHVARHRRRRPGLHRHAGTRPRRRRPVDGRPEASGRPHCAGEHRRLRQALEDEYKKPGRTRQPLPGRGRGLRSRSRRRRHRRHHVLHQHLEPERADRRRPARPQRRRQGPQDQALGEDLAGTRQPGRGGISGQFRPAEDLDKLGFNLVGFGCTTCIGNSGPLNAPISKTINDKGLIACRRALGQPQLRRPHFARRAGELPRLAAAGRRLCACRHGQIDLTTEPIGEDKDGNPVYLKDIWPSNKEIQEFIAEIRHARDLRVQICRRVQGRRELAGRQGARGQTYAWDDASTYVQNPPYFVGMGKKGPPASPTSRAPACSACSATRSPPTTSRRPVRSRRSRRPAILSDGTTASAWPTSTSTARGAATTKS
jgi:aconitate hydratase